MIKLFSVTNQDEVYTFLGGKKYKVGRKAGDITFPDDQSISREHAEIEVDHPRANLDNPSLLPTLTVTDVGSKFKTYINQDIDDDRGVGISTREPVSLSSGDRIRFGKQHKIFRVECIPLVVTGSTLKDLKKLKDLICKMGGHFVPEWSEKCDYVVMDSITLTIKAVCALLSGKYIVTPNYFEDLVASIQLGKEKQLDPLDYIPSLAEDSIQSSAVDFKPNLERTALFAGKTFVYYNNRQMKKFSAAVICGGGKNKLIGECSPAFLSSPDTLLFQPAIDVKLMDPDTRGAIEAYKKNGKRYVQESEISLAAVYVNLDKHCNPFYDFAQKIFNPVQTQTQDQVTTANAPVIIPETQEVETQPTLNSNSRVVIEESFNMTSDSDKSPSSSTHSRTEVSSHRNDRPAGSSRSLNPKATKSKMDDSMDPPSAKRRLEVESETPTSVPPLFGNEPTAKRQKSSATVDKPAKPLSKSGSRTLSSIFQMSDSDPDDDDDGPSIIPGTYAGVSSVSQPPSDSTSHQNLPHSNSVATPNKQPGVDSPAPSGTPFVDYVPGTPDMSDEDDGFFAELGINVPKSPVKAVKKVPSTPKSRSAVGNASRRKIMEVVDLGDGSDDDRDARNISELPTVKIPTLSTAQLPTLVMNPAYSSPRSKRSRDTMKESVVIKEEAEISGSSASSKVAKSNVGAKGTLSAWLTSTKRKTANDDDDDSDERKGTSKKTKTNGVSTDDILSKTGQIKLEDSQPDLKDVNRLNVRPAPVQVVSLIRKHRPDFTEDSNVTVQNGSPRNFKKFQRVLPLSLYNSTLQNNSNHSHSENQIGQKVQKPPQTAERISRQFIVADVKHIPDQKVGVEDPREQENFDFDSMPSTSRKTRKNIASEVVRRSGRGRTNSAANNTAVSLVCDVDVDMEAILTPSQNVKIKEDVEEFDPSDGMFDF